MVDSGQGIKLVAPGGVPFTGNLRTYAQDLDGLPGTFSRRTDFGPTWLTVNPDGSLTGTPPDGVNEEHNFIVLAKNDKLEADAPLTISVTSENNPPRWVNPARLPAAKAEKDYFQSVK